MSQRLYISPVIGNAFADLPHEVLRPKVADYGVSFSGPMPPANADGTSSKPWTLSIVEAANHTDLLADPEIYGLPVFDLDGKLSGMGHDARAELTAKATELGVPANLLQNADTYRGVIDAIGRQIDPAFDVDALGVA